jgi:hypothetical protein
MSYKIGARKPESAAFTAAAAALSLPPSSCAFVDDLGVCSAVCCTFDAPACSMQQHSPLLHYRGQFEGSTKAGILDCENATEVLPVFARHVTTTHNLQ